MGLRVWTEVVGTVVQSVAGRYSSGFDWIVNNSDEDRVANRRSLLVVAAWVRIDQATWQTSYGAYDNVYRNSTITVAGTPYTTNHKFDLRQARGVKYYLGNQTVFAGSAQHSQYITHDADGTKQVQVNSFINGTSSTNFTSGSAGALLTLPAIVSTFAAPGSITFNTPTFGSDQVCSWGAVSGAANYRLEYSLNGGAWTLETTTASTSYTVPAARFANMGTIQYRVRVEAKSGWNASAYTTGLVRTIASLTHATPASITFDTPIVGENELCSWGAVATAASYRLEYSLNGGAWTLETTTANTSYTVPLARFAAGGTIQYRVKVEAKTGYLESGYRTGALRTIDPGFGGIAINANEISKIYQGTNQIGEVIYGTNTIWKGV